jgi:hypothetical protein
MSRPRDEFDWDLVESLAMVEATEAFIAERLIAKDGDEINAKTIQAKIKMLQRRIQERYRCSFVQFRDQKLEHRRIALRKLQWKSAERGSAAMQIWLGKQYLEQKDKNAHEHTGKDGGPIEHKDLSKLSDAELDAKLAQLEAKEEG